VQEALMSALTAWLERGVPERPTAWLYRAAYNRLVGWLRQDRGRGVALAGSPPLEDDEDDPASPFFDGELRDELLRMLFVCGDDALPPDSRLVLALKTLCGFGVGEIARALFTTEANVHKRLTRARDRLRDAAVELTSPALDVARARLPGVHAVLYLLFNEGYLSSHAEHAVRRELCDEAIRLGTLLAQHPVGDGPETAALLALMHLHGARLAARQDDAGALILLEDQDRSRWDQEALAEGARWLARSAQGATFTRYHAEAGIAAEHAFAPSFAQTRWAQIADLYAMLERLAPSPLHTLHRAVAIAEWQGPLAALAALADVAPPTWLAGHHLWDAVLSDLHRRAGDHARARHHGALAVDAAPTPAVKAALRRRLGITSDGAP
jgi:RNA polymerase sigma factor (sigma-70 family)